MPSGTVRSVSVKGISYPAKADADFSVKLTNWKNERIPHSSGSMRKMIRQVQTVENVVLTLDGDDRDALARANDEINDFQIGFVNAAGESYFATGSIDFDTYGTADNDHNITLQPAEEWTYSGV
jgi:hypothetical protein